MRTTNKYLNSFRDIIVHFKDGTSKRYSCCNAEILKEDDILLIKPRLSLIDVVDYQFMEEVKTVEYTRTTVLGALFNILRILRLV